MSVLDKFPNKGDWEVRSSGAAKIFETGSVRAVGQSYVQKNYDESKNFAPVQDVQAELVARLFAKAPLLYKWASEVEDNEELKEIINYINDNSLQKRF